MGGYLYLILAFVVFCFGFVIARGAPYLPTKKRQIEVAFELLDLKKGDLLVDLGSGDGIVLKAAAEQGYRAIGYELNPLLVLYSKLRLWKYRSTVEVRFGDFWHKPLPPDTKGVFVFLYSGFMGKLREKLAHEASGGAIHLASFNFMIPDLEPVKSKENVHLYTIKRQ